MSAIKINPKPHLMMWKVFVGFSFEQELSERNRDEKEHRNEEDTSSDDSECFRSEDLRLKLFFLQNFRSTHILIFSFLLMSTPEMLAFKNISLRFGIRLRVRR